MGYLGGNLVVIWVVFGGYGGDFPGHGPHQKEEEASFVEKLVHDNVDGGDSGTDTPGQHVDEGNDNHHFHHLRYQFHPLRQFQIRCHSLLVYICASTIFRPRGPRAPMHPRRTRHTVCTCRGSGDYPWEELPASGLRDAEVELAVVVGDIVG